jgi:uncharacterized protein YbjT (DUF2867 family)
MNWIVLDLRHATRPEHWLPHLRGVDAAINCAGVLQDSAFDSTAAVHADSPAALFSACEKAGVRRVIQISAIGVDRDRPTSFSRTKAEGEQAIMATDLDWVILRPSVVVGRAAYGGSALFRGLAAVPVALHIPKVGKLQIVQLDDLGATIVFFLRPDAPRRVELDIAGPDRFAFDEVVAAYRRWLGWRRARKVRVPGWFMEITCRLGDFVGWLGWRPPIRSTAQREILLGAVGDPVPWTAMTGVIPHSLEQSFVANPASVQERWFAKLYLLKPVIFGVLVLFWIVTALISLGPGWEIGVGLMQEGGFAGADASIAVTAGAVADLSIGIGIAFRRTARPALYAALMLSLLYVITGTILAPRLWTQPLGPLLKVWPILALHLVALAILEDR